jgi:hypothetical protein
MSRLLFDLLDDALDDVSSRDGTWRNPLGLTLLVDGGALDSLSAPRFVVSSSLSVSQGSPFRAWRISARCGSASGFIASVRSSSSSMKSLSASSCSCCF